MKWLEIIEFNSEEENPIILEKDIEDLIEKIIGKQNKQRIKIYSRVAENIDFRIHLCQKSEILNKNGSSLGNGLSSALKEYGHVKHSIWV